MRTWLVPALTLAWAVGTTVIGVGLRLWQRALEERLRADMTELSRKARHDAVAECDKPIQRLWANKVDKELHEEQVGELKRRVTDLEGRK